MSDMRGHGALDAKGPMTWEEPEEVWLMVEGLDALEGTDGREVGGRTKPLLKENCDWCGERSGSGYFVAVRDQSYQVCPMCWGRAPAYVDSRRAGHSHEEACRMLSGNHGAGTTPHEA